jgi:hypothetical protein
MFITYTLTCALVGCIVAQSDTPAKDIRAELPRDVRIVLLGVPSVKNARVAQENLGRALADLQAELERPGPAGKTEQHKYRIFFRLGQLDDAMQSLAQLLRDQERIKGLESYRDFARALQLRSESLAGLSGVSEAPLVTEDDALPTSPQPASAPDLAKHLSSELAEIDRLLTQIELRAKPDEERKAQLEKDVGALGQFVFQIRNLTEDIRAAEAGQGAVRIDTNDIVRSVQGLVDVIRDLKREKELKSSTSGEPSQPRSLRRDRSRPR